MSTAAATWKSDTPAGTAERVKLLLVDDDRDNLLALHAVLEPLREELLLAESGDGALRLCLDHDFAAILLDVRMPGMDGFETARMIRSRKRSRQTPILFLTAYRSDEQLFRGYDLGAVDFLFKPIVPEILQSKVSVFVELSRGAQLLRRQAEALARAEQKFRAVLEAAPDAMVITDADGVIRLANSRSDSLFGHPREYLIGLNIRALIPRWEPPDSTADGTDPVHWPLEAMRMDAVRRGGTLFPAAITRNPFESDEGILITTAVRDHTTVVQAEERVRRINADLERRVADRTAELTRSNEALRQFAWAASHDVQEPTRMVVSYSQWLARSAAARLETAELEMLQFIEKNAERMQTLLAGLRQYIYISESGDQQWASVNCAEAVGIAVANLGLGSIPGVSVVCDELPTIESIEVLLVQLFQNLIGNAVKYRSDEPPCIRISAKFHEGSWIFSVRDNGIGIEPRFRDYIFGVFKRLHGKAYDGTGIGLAICKAAVDQLGGRIWVESEQGTGSTFYFVLPQKGSHEQARAANSPY
jgi:PAS domain S-box-containing protein